MDFVNRMALSFEDELVKIAKCRMKKLAGLADRIPGRYKTLGLLGAGALGYNLLSKAERDRRIGKQMRMQQGV